MMPHGRLLEHFPSLRNAEKQLLEKCNLGELASFGTVKPKKSTPGNSVRSEFLRFLLLGGDSTHPIHERGVQLQGAFVEGELDLESANICVPFKATDCVFSEAIVLEDAKFESSVVFDGSSLRGVSGNRLVVDGRLSMEDIVSSSQICIDGAQINGAIYLSRANISDDADSSFSAEGSIIKGDVFLREMNSVGGINFMDAHIHGQFNCKSATLTVTEGRAVQLEGAVIHGAVFFHGNFTSVGMVSLFGATINGALTCDGANIDGNGGRAFSAEKITVRGNVFFNEGFKTTGDVSFSGAELEGSLDLQGSEISGFILNRARVKGVFILQNLKALPASVSVSGSSVFMLRDNVECWGDKVFLDGFEFKFIHLDADSDAAERIDWLDRQVTYSSAEGKPHFHPQPWRQLKKVYEEMGYTEEAREIGIAYEERLRQFGLIGQMPKDWKPWRQKLFSRLVLDLHYWYGKLTGFGYRPHLLLGWFACVWLGCSAIYWVAASHGVFAPSNPIVFQNDAYLTCRPDRETAWQEANPYRLAKSVPAELKGEGNWYLCPELREEYTGFSPIAFSLDLLLPLVDLHQENDWGPLIATPKANVFCEFFSFFLSGKRLVRFVMWVEILSGWVFSLLFVAVVSGLTKRKD